MNSPIGIFDSGLGGLTVLREIAGALPGEDLIYVGDTARVPYGIKSAETVTRYSREICDFLMRFSVKAIVVACNTASALALSTLKPLYDVPILGVLEPGARAAARSSHSGSIAVIGTAATVKSESYPRAIRHLLPQAKILSRACPLFVPLVEEGWTRHEITRQVAEIYLADCKAHDIDTLILGCTHYPLLKELIQKVVGPSITLVDSAFETAWVLKEMLREKGLLSERERAGAHRFFTTDAPEKLSELAERFWGEKMPRAELAELSAI